MNLTAASNILRILASRTHSLTIRELHDAWGDDAPTTRSLERYMSELTAGSDGFPSLVDTDDQRPQRFSLNRKSVATWFMTDEAALSLLMSSQYLQTYLGGLDAFGIDATTALAEQVLEGAGRATRRIQDYMRLVPDGLGRLPASISPEVMSTVIGAIMANQRLLLDYTKAQGASRQHELSAHGLVMKDGTIYLLASRGNTDEITTFALHRASSAQLTTVPARQVPGFQLDRHIQDTHQLSHQLGPRKELLDLRLRVKPAAIYHFRERPLCQGQLIIEPSSTDECFEVQARIPQTILLIPFLLSYGDSLVVVEPKSLRVEMIRWISEMQLQYANCMDIPSESHQVS